MSIDLTQEDSHHLKNVLRVALGSQATVVSRESGLVYEGTVAALEPVVTLNSLKRVVSKVPASRVNSLIFALCKGDKNDFVCQKACELGVKNIVLWQSEHSVIKLKSSDLNKKCSRWQRIIEEAAKQSGQEFIPQLHLFLNLSQVLDFLQAQDTPKARRLCCSLAQDAVELRKISQVISPVHLLIGPEGDLSPSEEVALKQHGFELVSLGPSRLRSETAAVVAVAMVQGIWGYSA